MEDTVATLGRNLGTAAKLFRLLAKDGLQDDAFHILINDPVARKQFVDNWNNLVPSYGLDREYQRARDILGDDFISPQEVAAARGLAYTSKQFRHLKEILPKKEMLQWAHHNDFVVIAGPPAGINLKEIYCNTPELFAGKSDYWFNNELYSLGYRIETTWLIMRKDLVPKSAYQTWDEQKNLIDKNFERVPNIAEVAWAFATYKKVRNIWLIPNFSVRTSSSNSGDTPGGNPTVLGYHNSSDGLIILNNFSRNRRSGDVGILSVVDL